VYESEPILAHASFLITTSTKEVYPYKPAELLKALRDCLSVASVSPGEIGELVTEYWYCLARDRVCKGFPEFTYPVFTVEKFLDSFFHPALAFLIAGETKANETDIKAVLNGVLSFSHFIKIDYIPSPEMILDAYVRGTAIACCPRQPGIDLIIPMRLSNVPKTKTTVNAYQTPVPCAQTSRKRIFDDAFINGSNPLHRQPVLKDNPEREQLFEKRWKQKLHPTHGRTGSEINLASVSFILVQVKNSESNSAEDDIKIDPVYAKLVSNWEKPYLAVKHVLKSEREDAVSSMAKKKNRVGLVLTGIDKHRSKCLDEPLTKIIEELLVTEVNNYAQIPNLWQRLQQALSAPSRSFVNK
jgi:hypothetical protein